MCFFSPSWKFPRNNNKKGFLFHKRRTLHIMRWNPHGAITTTLKKKHFLLFYSSSRVSIVIVTVRDRWIMKISSIFVYKILQQPLVIIEYSIRYQLLWKFYTIKIRKEQHSNKTELSGCAYKWVRYHHIHTNRYESSENNKKKFWFVSEKKIEENSQVKKEERSRAISMIQHYIDDE